MRPDGASETSAGDADVPAAPRGRAFNRDRIVAGTAFLVSLSALAVSLVQTWVMMAQRDAAVWPRVSLYTTVRPEELVVGARNAGVGPAIVSYAQATLDGKPMASLMTLVDSAPLPANWTSSAEVTLGNLTGSVVAADEERELLHITGALARYVVQLGPRVAIDVCYCSVFDKCWTLKADGLGQQAKRPDITPVRACREPDGPSF